MRSSIVMGLAALLVAACGGSIAPVDDGTSGIGNGDDGGIKPADDGGGCVTRHYGADCSSTTCITCAGVTTCTTTTNGCRDATVGDDTGDDAGSAPDASDAAVPDGGLACGSLTCDAATSFCKIAEGGTAPIDGSPSVSYSCEPIPWQCSGAPTCGCLDQGCNCTDSAGAFTITCQYP